MTTHNEQAGAAAPAQPVDPTDPGYDVVVLREHIRHLERRVLQLSSPAAQAQGAMTLEQDQRLWCVNVHGPDDVYAMPSRAAALERANELNTYYGSLECDDYSPIMRAVVIEWPHSAESHAADMRAASAPTDDGRMG